MQRAAIDRELAQHVDQHQLSDMMFGDTEAIARRNSARESAGLEEHRKHMNLFQGMSFWSSQGRSQITASNLQRIDERNKLRHVPKLTVARDLDAVSIVRV